MQNEKTKKLLEEIVKSKEEMKVLKDSLTKKIQENFHGMVKELFINYPELKSISWRQYTPYFNDGEPCEFSSNHDRYPTINGNDEDYGENDEEEGVIDIVTNSRETYRNSSTGWKDVPNPKYNPYYAEIVSTVKKFLGLFDDDDMYDLFGDHTKVTITIDGCKTEEYDHD
jgi:hypothetical protein